MIQGESLEVKRGYHIAVSAGELVDRFLIEQVRAEMLGPECLQDQPDWSEAKGLLVELNVRVVEDLKRIHRRLWLLEGFVRDRTQANALLENARSIFEANDERHRLKAEIDAHFPTTIARRRTYGG